MHSAASSRLPSWARTRLRDIWQELRPRQWTKNLIVFTAFFFALGDQQQALPLTAFWAAAAAFLLFVVVSSGVYIFNDIKDIQRDRAHPLKALRPITAGRISLPLAWILACLLLGVGLGGAWLFSSRLGQVLSAYVGLQIAYSCWLKHLALVDVFVIALGFVLRAIAGGIAIQVMISPWLLICAFLLALFLALCKRRHEKRLMNETGRQEFRPSLAISGERLLDQLIAVTAGAFIVAYAIYTQWPDTVAKFHTTRLIFTLPFVVFGVFRYLHLVYCQAKGDQPEYILLTDGPLMISIALFGLTALWIVMP